MLKKLIKKILLFVKFNKNSSNYYNNINKNDYYYYYTMNLFIFLIFLFISNSILKV